jgi:hypothetical protein
MSAQELTPPGKPCSLAGQVILPLTRADVPKELLEEYEVGKSRAENFSLQQSGGSTTLGVPGVMSRVSDGREMGG